MHCSIFKILVSVVRSVPSSDSFLIISCNKSFVNTFLKIFFIYFLLTAKSEFSVLFSFENYFFLVFSYFLLIFPRNKFTIL